MSTVSGLCVCVCACVRVREQVKLHPRESAMRSLERHRHEAYVAWGRLECREAVHL